MDKANYEKYRIRKAALEDIPVLVEHHCLMFREIRTLQGKMYSEEIYAEMNKTQAEKLQKEMLQGLCHAWVVEGQENRIVSSGAISLYSFTASPENPSSTIGAYVHSIYTEKEHRGNKLSTCIMKEIISCCKEKAIRRILLVASNAGKPVYEKLGFEAVPNFMSLRV